MNLKDKFLTEFDGKGKVFSAFFSVLTFFALLGQIAPGLYEQMPRYSEWICGVTAWSAYNKQTDMNIVRGAMLGLPVLFLLFGIIYVWWNRVMKQQGNAAGVIFSVSYTAVLGMLFMGNASALQWMLLWACLFLGYCILGKKERTGTFAVLLEHMFFVVLAIVSSILCLSFFSASVAVIWQRISGFVPVLAGALFLLFVLLERYCERSVMPGWFQLILPFAWLGFVHFRYRYEKDGSLIELFASGRWKWMCLLLCVICLACAIYEKVKTKHTILFTTFIMTAVIRVFSQPEGMLNIDYFHNGEITMPMHQLVSYGKLPYRDVIPIHGMCDYYYGLINYIFFDGTYLSLNAAKTAGDLLIAVLLASVIYFFVEHKRQALAVVYFFVPFMIQGAGMRYWLLFVMFFVLFSERVSGGMQSLYAWILLSIAAIAWNASIGGAGALAFLPVVAYRFFRDVRGQWKEMRYSPDKIKRNLTCVAWGILVVIGLAFVPLFLKIVGYLRENTGTTLYVNGMEMLENTKEAADYFVPGLVNAQGDFWIVAFAFLIPLLITFAFCMKKQRNGAGEMFVTYLLAFWVLASYAFVRYDDGLRAGVLGVFFLLLTAVTLLWRSGKGKTDCAVTGGYVAVLALSVMLSGNAPFITADVLVLEREIPECVDTVIMGQEIKDPVVHVSGSLVSMPNLGTGFIQGNTLASLQNVNTLVQAANVSGQSIFDITNAVANAVLLDMPLYLPYSSAYNISNTLMQDKAVSMLEENLPDIILAAPEIRFDDAPFSYRSMKLYRYLMEQDYVPYKYENVIYLVRGKNPLPDAREDKEAFAQLMHKKNLAYLPAVWGSNMNNVSEPFAELPVKAKAVTTESGYRIVFDRPVSGQELTAVGIFGLRGESGKDMQTGEEQEHKVTMWMETGLANQKVEFEFSLKGEEYLIPVCTSPYVRWQEKIESVELTSQAWDEIAADEMDIRLYQ